METNKRRESRKQNFGSYPAGRQKGLRMKAHHNNKKIAERLKEEVGNQCSICGSEGSEKELVVDHCHTTGYVRGLLCEKCNMALGFFGDTIEGLHKAMEYLKKPKTGYEYGKSPH